MKVGKIALTFVCGILLVGLISDVSRADISPVSATTAAPIAFSTSVSNVIDGVLDYDSFLSLGFEGFGTFDGPYTVRFDLGASYNLTDFNLWNNAGYLYNDGEGVNAFALNFFDSSMADVGSYSGNAADILNKQTFTLVASDVKVVDFTVISNHFVSSGFPDRQYVDFYEVSFEGAVVPVPGAILLGMLGLGVAGIKLRKHA